MTERVMTYLILYTLLQEKAIAKRSRPEKEETFLLHFAGGESTMTAVIEGEK